MGDIGIAVGPNDQDDASQWNDALAVADLDGLVGGGSTCDAATLQFDVVSSNSFVLQFQYIFASEEYPEWIGDYNDPVAFFVTTNRVGANWIITTNNNIALIPGTNLPVTVNMINGGGLNIGSQVYYQPTNPQFYVDNADPFYSADPLYSASAPVFNIQYDGTTVRLTAQIPVSANVTNHIKIAIEDYGDDVLDSAIFIKAWEPGPCCQCQ